MCHLWGWVGDCPWDTELRRDFNLFFQAIGTILLSRKMAQEGYIDHWAKAAQRFPQDSFYAFARRITEIPKVVQSSRLEDCRWEGHAWWVAIWYARSMH